VVFQKSSQRGHAYGNRGHFVKMCSIGGGGGGVSRWGGAKERGKPLFVMPFGSSRPVTFCQLEISGGRRVNFLPRAVAVSIVGDLDKWRDRTG